MGNFDSRTQFEHGHIFLINDRDYAISGEELSGNVHLDLKQPFPAVSLIIEIEGDERWQWITTSTSTTNNSNGGSTSRTTKDTHKGSRKIIQQGYTIFTFPDRVALPGQYTFPFKILIPYELPSSAYFSGGSSSCASVSYIISAILLPCPTTGLREMAFKTSLIMREKPYIVNHNLLLSKNFTVKSCWGLRSKGQWLFETSFEKDSYSGNETWRAVWNIKNDCSIPVERIRVKVKQFVHLRSTYNSYRETKTKAERIFDGLEANGSTEGFNRYLDIPLHTISGEVNSYRYGINLPLYDGNIYVDNSMQPTTTGHIVNISYSISIKLIYNTVFFWTSWMKLIFIYSVPRITLTWRNWSTWRMEPICLWSG